MNPFLTTWITPEAIAATWEFTTPIVTELLDWVLPKNKRSTHPLPAISMKDLSAVLVNGLHSERGVIGWALGSTGISVTDFEPKPIVFTQAITAKEINDLKLIEGQAAKSKYISAWTGYLRDTTDLTTQAMASSFLLGSGTMTIRKNSSSGVIDETFVYGSIPTVTNTVDWDDAAALVSDAAETFQKMKKQLKSRGYGGAFTIRAGIDAWNALVKLVEGYVSTATSNVGGIVSLVNGQINIFGYIVEVIDYDKTEYSVKGATSTTDMLDPDLIYAMATNNKNVLKYCSLDRLDGQENLPIAITSDIVKGKILDLESDSKPFPLFDVYSFCTSDVMA